MFLNCRVLVMVFLLAATRHALAEDFPLVVETEPLAPSEQQKKFHLPPGFEIQLVAAEPDVRKPINMNFDHAGRLYFSQSVEYPFAAKAGATPRDTVRVIEGIGADGKAANVRTAVEGLNIPIGVLPMHDRLLVFGIPNIYSCRDEDGDGKYETREVLYGPFGQRDTHGLNNGFTRGLDGWIYACHGFANDSRVKGRDGNEVEMNSGNVYRFRADGSRIEPFTHGQVNPFGLCFDPLGNLYSADCHTLPAYMLLRGAYYPSFGKPHDGLGFGPPMMSHSHGSTGIAGIVYYAAAHFPPEYRDTLFIGNPITHRVNHDKLAWHGSTPKAIEQSDFLKCDDPWFRPVDLKLGPDGALYIADFYNRIIGHYEVDLNHPGRDRERGRIWRVIYTGTPDKPVEPPRLPDLTKLDLDELVEALGDKNLVVRTMATHELIDRFGESAADRLAERLKAGKLAGAQKAHASWIAAHDKGDAASAILADTIGDVEALARVNAVRAWMADTAQANTGTGTAAVTRAGESLAFIKRLLRDKHPLIRRAVSENLNSGQGDLELVPVLLDLWKQTDSEDAQLIHAIRIALRNCLRNPAGYDEAEKPLEADDRARLADVSLGVASQRSAQFVLGYIKGDLRAVRLPEMLGHVVRHLPAERLGEAFELTEKLRDQPPMRQQTALATVHKALEARGQQPPQALIAWGNDVAKALLSSRRERQVVQGAQLAREMKLVAVRPQLQAIASGNEFPGVRPLAIDACVACDPVASVGMLARLAGSTDETMALRQKAAQALASVNHDAAHRELLALLANSPAQLEGDLAAGLTSSATTASLLVAAIEAGKASPQVLRNALVAARLKQLKSDALAARVEKLTGALPAVDPRIRELIAARVAGFTQATIDAAEGKQVFVKTCAACHKIGGEGTKIGPDLDGIGNRGLERLAEDILDPSRNVDQAFRATLVTTSDGRSMNGLALREEGQVLVMADNQGKEVRVALADILERTMSSISPMPANVAEQLGEQEFYELLTFLLAHDQAPAAKR